MTTPERPSLADTLAHIDAVLAEPPILPMVGGVYLHSLQLQVRRPLGMQDLADIERVLNEPPPSPEPAPPDPDWVTFEPLSKPGWLARALRRLFT